jgi:hypothetical protein
MNRHEGILIFTQGLLSDKINFGWSGRMSPRLPSVESFRDVCLLKLLMPIGMVPPSQVLLAVSTSFLLAFSLTFCVTGCLSKTGHAYLVSPATLEAIVVM